MTKGTILIGGDAGHEIGHSLRRGLIAIGGNIGDLAGMNMLAGSIFVFGESGIRHGAGMKRGTHCLPRSRSPAAVAHLSPRLPLPARIPAALFRQLRKLDFAVPTSC